MAANLPDLARQDSRLCDKILKGANPAQLPVQQPTKIRAGPSSESRESDGSDGYSVFSAGRGRGDRMKRRAFIASLGGAAVWPLVARGSSQARR